MPEVSRYLGVGRSLATGGVLGLRRREVGRLAPLDLTPALSALEGAGPGPHGPHSQPSAGAVRARTDLATGATTAVALARDALARVLAVESALNCIIELSPDVLDQARAADARIAAGQTGPLLGIPVTIKDNIEVAGLHTTAGAEILANHVTTIDAPLVTALRDAGAVIVGKANLSELAGGVSRAAGFSAIGGQTVNARGAGFSPGGSSSGSAVSVAAGIVPLSVGTETSGSLIAPAAFNGVVAMKPSRGVIPGAGVVPLVSYQDSAGPVGRDVADVATLLTVLAGWPRTPELRPDLLSGVRLGVLRTDIGNQRSPLEQTRENPEFLARLDRALQEAGAVAVDAELGTAEEMAKYDAGFTAVVLGGLTNDTVEYLRAAGTPISSLAGLQAYNLARPAQRMPKGQMMLSFAVARGIGRAQYEQAALDHRERATDLLTAAFDRSGADALLSISNRHSNVYATAGFPAITLPAGVRSNGMPVGLTLIGQAGADRRLLSLALALEVALADAD